MRLEGSTLILALIAPIWQTQPWYPVLLEILIEFPLLLSQNRRLLEGPTGKSQPLVAQGTLKSDNTLQWAFQNKLQNLSLQGGAKTHVKQILSVWWFGWCQRRDLNPLGLSCGVHLFKKCITELFKA